MEGNINAKSAKKREDDLESNRKKKRRNYSGQKNRFFFQTEGLECDSPWQRPGYSNPNNAG
ncbi:hypothetical protein JYU14_05300 [Simkania negevensis]|uniref:Uncharacterized protein n=1 Tax=Simkania negevensis TaxID=83561 RepID=A0ABS3ATM4_9BACT|nr:hypothetical protein [Simkania negevensis]